MHCLGVGSRQAAREADKRARGVTGLGAEGVRAAGLRVGLGARAAG